MERQSARTLLAGVIDYAGLFPPAARSMPDAVAEFATAQRGADAWLLGRFVVPAGRLAEFAGARAAARLLAPCSVSAIVRDGSEADRANITAFNLARGQHFAVVDAVESRPETPEGIDWLARSFAAGFDVYVEVPAGDEAPRLLERVAARGLRAKVRTGGLAADAFPAPGALVQFLDAAVRLGVTFKATAGLHHAMRGSYPLTYEADAAHAAMYGYLNVLLATTALHAGHPAPVAERLLCESDAATLRIAEDTIEWGDVVLPIEALRATRRDRLVSFGSCSFREPADDYHALLTPAPAAHA